MGRTDSGHLRNDLDVDAWGRQKAVIDKSLFHGMFTFNVPVSTWYETFNGTVRDATSFTSVDGALVCSAVATNGTTGAYVKSPNITVTNAGKYLVKFRARETSGYGKVLMGLRRNSPITTHLGWYGWLDSDWRDYEIEFDAIEATTSLYFYMSIPTVGITVEIDSLSIIESTFNTIQQRTFLAYNETSAAKDITLPTGTWNSVDGTQIDKKGTVNVPAYGSYMMIKE
jgi:hypothetical protein